tara:strand:+ start:12537 stop:14036 length:1500 start_codon:yes stop_codon:yes gene_type:complete
MKFKVYKKEISDGIAEDISSSNTMAYASLAVPYSPSEKELQEFKILAGESIAKSNPEQLDLYYLNSVLVSTGWNKNDDVFDVEQVWAARKTPEDKQFNFMHNEADIIGHITANMVVDGTGNEISDELSFDELPSQFDIVTSAVLYNSWSNPELQLRMNTLVAEIEEGKWFVSMECLFNDFDYAVITPEGQEKVISRDEASAFLSKHLRAYGGTGEYEGYQVGRMLKNISFSGKGLVDNPANPKSVILESNPFSKSEAKSITEFNIEEYDDMADERLVQEVEDLKAKLASALTAQSDLQSELANASTEALTIELEEVKAEVATKIEAITTLEEQIVALTEEKDTFEATLAKNEEKLNEALATIEEKAAEAKLLSRKSALVEAGASEEEVEELLASFADTTDEMFEQVVVLAKKGFVPFKKKDDEEKEDDDDKDADDKDTKASEESDEEVDDAEASEEVLEEAEEQAEAALVDAGETEAVKSARAVASEWLTENVLKTTKQ